MLTVRIKINTYHVFENNYLVVPSNEFVSHSPNSIDGGDVFRSLVYISFAHVLYVCACACAFGLAVDKFFDAIITVTAGLEILEMSGN